VQTELDQHYPNARVIVTANGVDVDVFEHDLGTRKAIRTGQGAEPSDVVALFVGGDWDRKGLALAIESVAEARQSGASMHLWVLGTGDTERFRRHATEQGVADLVTFVGHHQDTAGWYQAADVYLCCSLYEAFSLAMIEAAATALPVVSTLVGGAAEIVTGNDEGSERGGVIVERNAAVIGDVLARLAADPSERGRLGRIAQRRASGFDWDRLAEQTDQVYQDLLNASSRTSDRTA
jgi:glycosyltransferase involved in cell wall biosynthesis